MLKATFLHEGQWDITNLDEMIVSLRNHSLITLIPGIGTQLVQMHPVAHGWVKAYIPEQEKARYRVGAVLLLSLGSHVYYTPCVQYLASHITHLSAHWDKLHINTVEAFAHILHSGGSFEDALQMRERVANELRSQVEPDSIDIANSAWSLALSYRSAGRHSDAELLQLESLSLYKQRLGEHHPDTIMISSNLAITYRDLGRLKEAEALQEEVLKLRKGILGERHPNTILASSNLAATYYDLGQLKEAELLLQEVLKLGKEVLGERHPYTITASSNLAITYRELGQLKEAEALLAEVLRIRKEVLGERHPDTISASNNIADIYLLSGRLKDAEALQVETLSQAQDILGNQHPTTVILMLTLAEIYESLCRKCDALKLLDIAEHVFARTFGNDHTRYLECQQVRTRVEAQPDG